MMNLAALILSMIILLCGSGEGRTLSLVRRIVLDKSRSLRAMRVRAVRGEFVSDSPFWLQLWRQVGNGSYYQLNMQLLLQPPGGTLGRRIVVELPRNRQFDVFQHHKMGITNQLIPGPLDGSYRSGAGVVLSDRRLPVPGGRLNETGLFLFDDLRLPYHIPLELCETSGCRSLDAAGNSSHGSVDPTIKPAVVGTFGTLLTGDRWRLFVFFWNFALSVVVLVVLLALLCACAELSRLRSRPLIARYAAAFENASVLDEAFEPPVADYDVTYGGGPEMTQQQQQRQQQHQHQQQQQQQQRGSSPRSRDTTTSDTSDATAGKRLDRTSRF